MRVLDIYAWFIAIRVVDDSQFKKLIELGKSRKITLVMTDKYLKDLEKSIEAKENCKKNKNPQYLKINKNNLKFIKTELKSVEICPQGNSTFDLAEISSDESNKLYKNNFVDIIAEFIEKNNTVEKYILEAAIATKADIIITNKSNLLSLNQGCNLPIFRRRTDFFKSF